MNFISRTDDHSWTGFDFDLFVKYVIKSRFCHEHVNCRRWYCNADN